MNEPTKTPETDAHQLKPEMAYDRLWSDFARKLERERDEARNALRLAESAAVAAFNERDILTRENERLHAHLDELTAPTIHSCGDHCQRPNCVRRREMTARREYSQNLARERDKALAEAAHWKANHDNQVAIKSAIIQRPDLGDRAQRIEAMREAIQEAYDAIKASPYPDQQALDKLKPFITP
jgi:hypothetical protein